MASTAAKRAGAVAWSLAGRGAGGAAAHCARAGARARPRARRAQPYCTSAADGDAVFEVRDVDFDARVLRADVPVVLDCYASWCGPCRVLAPMLEKAVRAHDGAVKLAKLNVDDNQKTAASLNVSALPTVFSVHGGKVAQGFVGLASEEAVQDFVEGLAAGK